MKDTYFLTVNDGFRACARFIGCLSDELGSKNLATLADMMDEIPTRQSIDPAMYFVWSKLWGVAQLRSAEAVAPIAFDFIRQEGDWGYDEPALWAAVLERLFKLTRPREPGVDMLWDRWASCATQ